jgi:gamma-polyglutamate biosynthesis protein CapC
MELELFAVGLLLSLAFAGMTGISAGGIIVPSYMVLYVDQPGRVVGTFVAALFAFLAAKLLSRYLLLFGKRQFVVMILCGAVCMSFMSHLLPELVPQITEFKVLGWVIPGLIAHAFQRQGVVVTSAAMVIVTVGAYFGGRLIVQFI